VRSAPQRSASCAHGLSIGRRSWRTPGVPRHAPTPRPCLGLLFGDTRKTAAESPGGYPRGTRDARGPGRPARGTTLVLLEKRLDLEREADELIRPICTSHASTASPRPSTAGALGGRCPTPAGSAVATRSSPPRIPLGQLRGPGGRRCHPDDLRRDCRAEGRMDDEQSLGHGGERWGRRSRPASRREPPAPPHLRPAWAWKRRAG